MTTLARAVGVEELLAPAAKNTKPKMEGRPARACHCWPEALELGLADHCIRCGYDTEQMTDAELTEARSAYGWQLLTKAVHYTALELRRKAEDGGLVWEDEVREYGYLTEGGWT
jgi:hypothetical protein